MSSTGEPAAKRARIEITPWTEIDLQEFALKGKDKGKNGHLAYPLLNGETIRFNLPPSDWTRAPLRLRCGQ